MGFCNVGVSEVTSYALDGPETRHLKFWSCNVFSPTSSHAQVLQDSRICNFFKCTDGRDSHVLQRTHTHTPHVLDLRCQLYNDFGRSWRPLNMISLKRWRYGCQPDLFSITCPPSLSLWHGLSTATPPPHNQQPHQNNNPMNVCGVLIADAKPRREQH